MEKQDVKINYKILVLIIGILLTVSLISLSTYAYWEWQSAEEQKTAVVFSTSKDFMCAADGGGNITSSDVVIVPSTCTDSRHAIQREVTVTPSILSSDVEEIKLDLWLELVDNTADLEFGAGLTNSVNFKYALTTSSTSCTDGVVMSGNFNGKTDGDTLPLLSKNFSSSTTETYYLYIWLDKEETSLSTTNQTFNLTLGGECTNQMEVPLVGDAYAIYTSGNSTLTFTRSETSITAGDTYKGETVTAVYTGIETNPYTYNTLPWKDYAEEEGAISSVVFEDTIRPVSTASWFGMVSNPTITNLEKLDTSNVTDMSWMFSGWGMKGTGYLDLNLSTFDTSNVRNMSGMFAELIFDSLLIGISSWDTSSVTNMDYMFYNTNVGGNDLDLSNWDVSNVTSYDNFSVDYYGNNIDNIIPPNFS